MVEEIYEQFKKKRAEALQQPGFKEKELTPEKEKEILKEAISNHVQKVQSASDNQQQAVSSTTQQIQAQPKEKQVKLLTNLAFEKGIAHAIEVVRRMDDPYLLDEFHDALVDEFYIKLVQEGKLKQL